MLNRVACDIVAEMRAVEIDFLLSLFDFRGGGSYSMSEQTDRSMALARPSQAPLGKRRWAKFRRERFFALTKRRKV